MSPTSPTGSNQIKVGVWKKLKRTWLAELLRLMPFYPHTVALRPMFEDDPPSSDFGATGDEDDWVCALGLKQGSIQP